MEVPDNIMRSRPNKTARGMTKTLYRSHRERISEDTLMLSVHGTLDRLAWTKWQIKPKRVTIVTYGISDKGKLRLARLKRRFESRREHGKDT